MDNQVKMLRGHINIIILKALEEGDKYGYEIGKYIEEKTGGGYKLKQATLYSSLNRLEERDIISSYWGEETDTNGGRRKYFSLTEDGKKIARQNISNWNEHRKIIDKIVTEKTQTPLDTQGMQNSQQLQQGTQTPPTGFAEQPKENAQQTHTGAEHGDNIISQYLVNKNTPPHGTMQKDNSNEYKRIISKLLNNVKDRSAEDSELSKPKNPSAQQQGGDFTREKDIEEDFSKPNSTLYERSNQERTAWADSLLQESGQVTSSSPSAGESLAYAQHTDTAAHNQGFLFKQDTALDAQAHTRQDTDTYAKQPGTSQPSTQHGLPVHDELLESFRRQTGHTGAAGSEYSLLPKTATPFDRLRQEMDEQGYVVRPYVGSGNTKRFLLLNKINFLAMLLLYAVMAAQTLIAYLVLQPTINISLDYYLYAAGICLIFPLASAVQYYVYPHKKTKKRYYTKDLIASGIMYFLVAVLAISAIAFIFGVDTSVQAEFLLKIVLPSIYASNFIFHAIIWSALYQGKNCFSA